jgi:hypothetical protein
MKIEPRRLPQAQPTAQQDDTTTEFGAGTEPRIYRRTTVTVERETVSVLLRRPADGDKSETHIKRDAK